MSNKPKSGVDNLIPTSERSKDEARELGKKGGKASGKARQEKKRLREAVEAVLSRKYDVNGEEVTGYIAAAMGVFNKAMAQGDPSAFNAIRDLIGEKPVEKVESDSQVTVKMGINKDFLK